MLPPFLKPGDTIGICAPARKVSREDIESGIRIFEKWGFRVKESENLYGANNQFSGTDDERLTDLQQLLDDKDVKAVFAARGGYGCVRLIDRIDFTKFRKHPKWICGFSDLTVLHSHIHNHFRIATLHCAMVYNLSGERYDESSADKLRDILTGNLPAYSIPVAREFSGLQKQGRAEGILTGGNLSILYSISGTFSNVDARGKILFIEDLDEYRYHIDRMMWQLKRNGTLKHLAGLIVGGMNDMRDNLIPFGSDAEQIIADAVKEYDYPVCYGFPSGHLQTNMPLVLGENVRLEINAEEIKLNYT